MENFIYSLNATMPVFLVMVLGYFLRKLNIVDKPFTDVADKVVFKVALPVYLFIEISSMDLGEDFDLKFAGFCFVSTVIMIGSIWILAELFIRDKKMVGSFVQGAFRSSAAILGVAFAANIYGNAGMVPIMIIASVPLFNIMSVIVLVRGASSDDISMKENVLRSLKKIVTNPIIIGIVLGIPFAALHVKFPVIINNTLYSVSRLSTPLALLSIGASFNGKDALVRKWPTIFATAIKLLILPAIFLPIAYSMGFRGEAMVALLILFGSPSTVSGYIMAKNMGNDEKLSSGIIVCTTVLSSISITFFIFIMKSVGAI